MFIHIRAIGPSPRRTQQLQRTDSVLRTTSAFEPPAVRRGDMSRARSVSETALAKVAQLL